jgi:hypothetical protein
MEAESARRGRQLNAVITSLHDHGYVDVQTMLDRGITRTATYIWELRKHGWNIETMPRKAGHTAVYRLLSRPPLGWYLPRQPRTAKTWRCVTCNTPGTPQGKTYPTVGRGYCQTCSVTRMFKLR